MKIILQKIIGCFLGICILIGGIYCYCHMYLKQPKISVILPTYNREKLLPRALDSILTQTYPDFELLVINDGSTDNTQKILEDYAAKDRRIKIINHKENKGLVYGLNEGLQLAKGEYIARMDDDDVSYPKRFEKQLAFMETHPEYAAIGTWGGPFDDDSIYVVWQQTDFEYIKILTLLGMTPMIHSSLLMRYSFLKEHHIHYKSQYVAAEDLPLLTDIIYAGGKLTNIAEKLMKIRKHNDNSPEYYEKQRTSRERFIENYMKLIFNASAENVASDKCALLKIIKEKNQNSFVDQAKILRLIEDNCL